VAFGAAPSFHILLHVTSTVHDDLASHGGSHEEFHPQCMNDDEVHWKYPANGTGMNLQHGTDHEIVICDVLWFDKAGGNPYLHVLMMHTLQHPGTCHSGSPGHNDNDVVCQMSEKLQTRLNPNNSYCEDPVRNWGNPPHL
jgi:hypothetical protein